MERDNPWELYSSKPGWRATSRRLDAALAVQLSKLDKAIGYGTNVAVAVLDVQNSMTELMSKPKHSLFGASDTEPRAELHSRIRKHLAGRGIRLDQEI